MKIKKNAPLTGALQVTAPFPAYEPVDSDFRLKDNSREIGRDIDWSAPDFRHNGAKRRVWNASAVIGLAVIILIAVMAGGGAGKKGKKYL